MRFLEIFSETEMFQLGKCLGERVKPGDLLFLSGDLGTGKTTLTKGIATGLNISEPVTSPTFQLIKSYQGKYILHHLDLYRLKNKSELEMLEIDELLESGVTVIEWGALLIDYIGPNYLEIDMEYLKQPDGRKLVFNAFGTRYLKIIEELELC